MDNLIKKSYKQYDYISRYQSFPTYYNKQDDKYIYGTTAQLDDTTPYVLHTIDINDNFDSLALKYYQNATLWWVICDYNHIQNPYTQLKIGDKIKIPTLTSISFDM